MNPTTANVEAIARRGLLFGSIRPGSVRFIKEQGYEAYAETMTAEERMSLRR